MKTTKTTIATLCLVAIASIALGGNKKATGKQTEWFNAGKWHEGITAKPSPATDIAQFARHYNKFPERWQLVFKFLRENDLNSLPAGKQQLSNDVTVIIQDYTTKAPGNEQLEAHQKKIDLQYMVSGKELHGTLPVSQATEVKAYDPNNDVAFFLGKQISYYVASPDQFSIFFPSDAHIPNIQFGEKAQVRKIVFKINME